MSHIILSACFAASIASNEREVGSIDWAGSSLDCIENAGEV